MMRKHIYFYTSMGFTAIAPGIYLMYAMGIFKHGILTSATGIATGVYAGFGFMIYQILRTLQKRFMDKDNPNIKNRAYGAGISHASPWVLLLVFTGLIYFGIGSIITHIVYIVGFELTGSFFVAKHKYWELYEIEANKNNKDKGDV